MAAPENNLPAFREIEQISKKTGYGISSMILQFHGGVIVNLTANNFKAVRFQAGNNAKATEFLLGKIKLISDSKKSGNLNFSIGFSNGEINRIELQESVVKSFSAERGIDGT